jgi:hypothetical protein
MKIKMDSFIKIGNFRVGKTIKMNGEEREIKRVEYTQDYIEVEVESKENDCIPEITTFKINRSQNEKS